MQIKNRGNGFLHGSKSLLGLHCLRRSERGIAILEKTSKAKSSAAQSPVLTSPLATAGSKALLM